jgi:hypothetical protein
MTVRLLERGELPTHIFVDSFGAVGLAFLLVALNGDEIDGFNGVFLLSILKGFLVLLFHQINILMLCHAKRIKVCKLRFVNIIDHQPNILP